MATEKICMSVFNDLSADQRVYREAKTLRDNGYEVTVIGIRDRGSGPPPNWPGVTIKRIPIKLTRRPFPKARYLEHLLKLTRTLRGLRADVYHAHDLDTLLASYLASKLTGAKLVYDAHELMVEESAVQGRPLTRTMWWLLESLLIGRADVVFTVNPSIAAELQKRYTIAPPQVLINCPQYRKTERTQKLRELLGIGPSKATILHLGGLLPGAGLEALVQAMSWVANGVLVFLGGGPAKSYLQNLVSSKGCEERVKFLDPVPLEMVHEYAASADVGLAVVKNSGLSYYLSLPNKIFEYMMAGVPIVASDFPERGKIVRENHIGLAVDPSNPRAIAEAIDLLLKDRDLHRQMVENCRKSARRYNWEREAQKLLAIYRSL